MVGTGLLAIGRGNLVLNQALQTGTLTVYTIPTIITVVLRFKSEIGAAQCIRWDPGSSFHVTGRGTIGGAASDRSVN
jgi:hypothetical protein